MKSLVKFIRDEEGASLAEYGLLIGIIVVGVAVILGTLRSNVASAISKASTNVNA